MLTATGLKREFADRILFENLDLELESGQCIALVGPSGSGKSQLLRILAQLESSDSGTLSL